MTNEMEELIAEVCEGESMLAGQSSNVRKAVIANGKKLAKLQKLQKAERLKAEAAGEVGQTWKEWCEEQKGYSVAFPAYSVTKQYILISKYPGAYQVGMSIKEAYKEAGKWKANNGAEPFPTKVSVSSRTLATIARLCGKTHKRIESLMEKGDIVNVATEEEWTEDEIAGARDELTLTRQSCNVLLRQLNEIEMVEDA